MGKRTTPAPGLLWNFPRTARELGWTESALRGRVRRRQIPFIKIGQTLYFSPDKLKAWLESRATTAA
jgi:hypothetical protein